MKEEEAYRRTRMEDDDESECEDAGVNEKESASVTLIS